MSTSIPLIELVNDKKYSKIAAVLQSDELSTSESTSSLLTYQALVLSRQYTKFLNMMSSVDPNCMTDAESFLLGYVYYSTGEYRKALQRIPEFNELSDLSSNWLNLYAQICYAMNDRSKALAAFDILKDNSSLESSVNHLAAYCSYGGCYYVNSLPANTEFNDFDYLKNLAIAYDLAGCEQYSMYFADEAFHVTENSNNHLSLKPLMNADFAIDDAKTKFEEYLKQRQIHNAAIKSRNINDVVEKVRIDMFKDAVEQDIARLNLAIAHFRMKNMDKAKTLIKPLLKGYNVKAYLLGFELELLTKEEIMEKFGEDNPETKLYFSKNDLSVLDEISDEKVKSSLSYMATSHLDVDSENLDHPALLEKMADYYLFCHKYNDAIELYRRIGDPHSGVTAKIIICLSFTDPNEAELLMDDTIIEKEGLGNEEGSVDELINSALQRRSKTGSKPLVKSDQMNIRLEEQKKKNLKQRLKQRNALLSKYAEAGIEPPKPQTWVSTKKHKKKRFQRYNQRFTRGSQGLAAERGAPPKNKIRSTAHLEVGGIGSLKIRNKRS